MTAGRKDVRAIIENQRRYSLGGIIVLLAGGAVVVLFAVAVLLAAVDSI